MATLPDEKRREFWADFMDKRSRDFLPIPLTKPELRTLIDATDAGIGGGAASIEDTIPAEIETVLADAVTDKRLTAEELADFKLALDTDLKAKRTAEGV